MNSIRVIGAGRVGSAVSARLVQRGVELRDEGAELVLLCVPDRAIAAVAGSIEPGPWVAHVSGATPLAALEPHVRRFSVHPLQTFTLGRGPEQLDGAWAAVTGETEEARTVACGLAETLGLHPFDLDDGLRTVYHAGAAIASNYLVTLYRTAARLFEDAGAPPEALVPLMTANDRERLPAHGPDLARRLGGRGRTSRSAARVASRARADVPRAGRGNRTMKITRTIAETRRALRGVEDIGLVPTMGAYHEGHLSLFRFARAENEAVVTSLFVNPAQFGDAADLNGYPRDEDRDARLAEESGVDLLFIPAADELYPSGYETWIEVEQVSRGLEGEHRPGHFRGVATICLKLFNIVRPRRVYFGQKDAQQVEVVRRMIRDLDLEVELRVRADRARRRRARALVPQRAALRGGARARPRTAPRLGHEGRRPGASAPRGARRGLRRGCALRSTRSRRRRPRRLRPPDRQRPPREGGTR